MKTTSLLVLFSTTIALASFGPPVRVDHQSLPEKCHKCAMAIGPGAPSSQPIYVVFEVDTGMPVRADIMFQKSTDGGRTWLPTDVLVRRGAPCAYDPDITTDSDGSVYVVYENVYPDTAGVDVAHILCTRSSDGGATWSTPARVDDESRGGIGLIRIVADSAGNLFVAWNQLPGGLSHVFTSVSTDKGVTWSPRVCVDNDTLTREVVHPEAFVQPGTNHYLVAATARRWVGDYRRPCAYLYRSTDRGQTFEPGVQLDTFNWYAGTPHVVADRDHIVCDYFGGAQSYGDSTVAEARTFYTQADSWGRPVRITNLDSLHELYNSGTLALSRDGRVHTALMVQDTAVSHYGTYYTSSSDHGVSWSDIEIVHQDTTEADFYPDIVVDMAGHAYVVWSHGGGDSKIWFSTNNPAAIAEVPTQPTGRTKTYVITDHDGIEVEYQLPVAAHVRAALHDAVGRRVGMLDAGEQKAGLHQLSWNRDQEGRRLSAGTYFVLLDMGEEQTRLKAVLR
jgi:hypothetical protein